MYRATKIGFLERESENFFRERERERLLFLSSLLGKAEEMVKVKRGDCEEDEGKKPFRGIFGITKIMHGYFWYIRPFICYFSRVEHLSEIIS